MKFSAVVSSLFLLWSSNIDQAIAGEELGLQGCADDGNFQYVHVNMKGKQSVYERGCEHVARKPKRRCRKKIDEGQRVSDICPYTCGNCMNDDSDDFVLEGDRIYIGCDDYAFNTKISCGVFGDDPGLCLMKSVFVGIASVNGTKYVGDMPVTPFPSYGANIDELDPDAVCIGSGVFSRDRIKDKKMLPTPLITSNGCSDDQKQPDYEFVVKGEFALDGSNDIQLDFSRNYGFSYYTTGLKGTGLYRAFFSNYTTSSTAISPSEESSGGESTSTLGPDDRKDRRLSSLSRNLSGVSCRGLSSSTRRPTGTGTRQPGPSPTRQPGPSRTRRPGPSPTKPKSEDP